MAPRKTLTDEERLRRKRERNRKFMSEYTNRPDRKAAKIQYDRNRRLNRKKEFFNTPCVQCGCTDVDKLEADHIDPTTKDPMLRKQGFWNRSEKFFREEIAKCQVLCKDCHWAKTARERGCRVTVEHGTYTCYGKGCRCEECRASATEYHRQRRKNLTENG